MTSISKERKEAQIKVYAQNHPNESASSIYERFKGSEYGVRKTDALRYVREARKAKPVSETKRYKSIPAKYRSGRPTPQKPVRPSVEYAYPVEKLPPYRPTKNRSVILSRLENHPGAHAIAIVKTGQGTFYIKFKDESSLISQTNKIEEHYGRKTDVTYTGPVATKGNRFVSQKFYEEARRRGVSLG